MDGAKMNVLTIAHKQMLEDGAPPEALRTLSMGDGDSEGRRYSTGQSRREGSSPHVAHPITNSDLARRIEAAKRLRAEIALMVSDEDGLLSEEDRQYIRDSFEGETTLEAEIAAALRAADDDHVLLLGIDARMKELKERKERLMRRDEIRLGLIEAAMIKWGQEKLETPLATVFLRKNPPSVVVEDESAIPTEFFKRQDPQLSKDALRKVLIERHKALDAAQTIKDEKLRDAKLCYIEKEHPPIPGCRLETELRHVNIRRK